MKQQLSLKITDLGSVKQQLMAFSELFDTCNIYDSNEIKAPLHYGRFEMLCAFGCLKQFKGNFNKISSAIESGKAWVFGYLSYESHKKLNNGQTMSDEEAFFYVPEIVCRIETGSNEMTIENNGLPSQEFDVLMARFVSMGTIGKTEPGGSMYFTPCTPKEIYLSNIERIKDNILNGDYYEINYCQKFEYKGRLENVISSFDSINRKSPTPFAAFVKNRCYNILCTSPERFVLKMGDKLVSQPIKGTNKRLQGIDNETQMEALRNSKKEIAENVMIVDLVRNDLARICTSGSIVVDELCVIYPFALVNQMISTISGKLKQETSFSDIVRAMFPMGSMTGAPKIEVMKNIAFYETKERNLYSGTIGYFMPNGDFDFNVVIRTIVEDINNNIISYHVGGAITYDSIPENEYEECLLKAKGLSFSGEMNA